MELQKKIEDAMSYNVRGLYKVIQEHSGKELGEMILADIGAGANLYSSKAYLYIASNGDDEKAREYAKNIIIIDKKNLGDIINKEKYIFGKVIQHDIENGLPLGDETCDIAAINSVLNYIGSDNNFLPDWLNLFEEVKRVLKNGGYALGDVAVTHFNGQLFDVQNKSQVKFVEAGIEFLAKKFEFKILTSGIGYDKDNRYDDDLPVPMIYFVAQKLS